MPTVNPRINVTLSPSLDSLVSRLSVLERVSKSTVLRELLETAEPALLQAVALMEAAQGASAVARKNLAHDLCESVKAAEETSSLMLQRLATQTRDMVDEAEQIRGRRPASGQAAGLHGVDSAPDLPLASGAPKQVIGPPSSKRGVKSSKQPQVRGLRHEV